jgi:hypothetical protein
MFARWRIKGHEKKQRQRKKEKIPGCENCTIGHQSCIIAHPVLAHKLFFHEPKLLSWASTLLHRALELLRSTPQLGHHEPKLLRRTPKLLCRLPKLLCRVQKLRRRAQKLRWCDARKGHSRVIGWIYSSFFLIWITCYERKGQDNKIRTEE